MASFEYAGITETLKPGDENYKAGLLAAGEALKEAVDLFNSPSFASRDGWKKETESGSDVVYSKHVDDRKLFALSAELPVKVEVFFNDCWDNFDSVAEWNNNFAFSKLITRLTPNVDIFHYGAQDILIIKGRDFVVGRMKRKIGDNYYLGVRSFDLDAIPESKEKVRAILHLGAGRFKPHPSDANRMCFDYVISCDFRGMIPKAIVNQAMGRLVLSEAEVNRKHVLDLLAKK